MRSDLLLLAERSIALRYLVLTTLVEPADPAEPAELARLLTADPLIAEMDETQDSNGTWRDRDHAWALYRYGVLGLDTSHEPVARAVEYLLSKQTSDGSWPLPAGTVDDGQARSNYDSIPLQTALPLIGLAAVGLATDPRCERGYQWLLDQRIPDGAWPTGRASGVNGYVAGYRRLPHSRWGCRSNTTAALLALSRHPHLRGRSEATRAMELLLARETHDAALIGFETARLFGFEPVRGFFTRFGRFDPALALQLAVAHGAGTDDERVADLAKWIESQRGANGLWEYSGDSNASAFVTWQILSTLAALTPGADIWVGNEPRTPFTPYPRSRKRW